MKVKTLTMMAGLGGSLLMAASADAAYSVVAQQYNFALNGTTPLTQANFPTYPGGLRVIEVFVVMDDPTDQVVGVVGSPANPFSVATLGGTGFRNSAVPNDKAPLNAIVGAIPSLNWDSFFTIGLRSSGLPGGDLGGVQDQVIVAPGTPGPNTDKWPNSPATSTNMAWTVPPTIDGVPTAQSVAGTADDIAGAPTNGVLIMRLVVAGAAGAAGQEEIDGTFGILIFDNAMGAEVPGSFTTVVPAPGALALLGLAGLAGTTRRRRG
jgi:hypothetical protein